MVVSICPALEPIRDEHAWSGDIRQSSKRLSEHGSAVSAADATMAQMPLDDSGGAQDR